MALLTPKDIKEHTFQTVRFKEGYDVDEVDDFLDQVTETVEALGRQAVAGGQATQTLGPDVTNLNAKISDLTGQVQQLQSENAGLKNAVAQAQQAAQAGNDQAAQLASAKLSEAEESNRALSSQNEQLKGQVDQLNAQIDQLTAQAAQASGNQEAVGQQIAAIQQERDQFRAANEELVPVSSPLLSRRVPPLSSSPLRSLNCLVSSKKPSSVKTSFVPRFPRSSRALRPVLCRRSLASLPCRAPSPSAPPPC